MTLRTGFSRSERSIPLAGRLEAELKCERGRDVDAGTMMNRVGFAFFN